ncbi:NADPH-dependent FMN reductase [Gordonia terrae]|uniref:NADPH-dependent FMN reductase n=1 Tax=Gordonia terrae TaxID=2055 RepID=A0A2I1RA33_9ACTN|nr:NAD(P)H-dependent oxidoreductase [Gordonia terrae]PKZ66003.1 NADPH-dependent FMN reductase [Gordonia terrae]
MTTTVVAGNPKPGSRTLDAARRLARALTGTEPDHVVDVIELGTGLLAWGDTGVQGAVETVASSDLVVVASPTFKATYTGVLKLFLDQFATGEGLRDVTAVPLMLGAGPAHAMAPDLLLKPILVELGAVCPAPGLYLMDSTYTTDSRIADYTDRWSSALVRSGPRSAGTTG